MIMNNMRVFFIIYFLLVNTIIGFAQQGTYYNVHISNLNEISLDVLSLNEDSTYVFYSLFCNAEEKWTNYQDLFTEGKWAVINKHEIELKTYNYLVANNETKKLLCVLSCRNYLARCYVTLKFNGCHLKNENYSKKPLVRWKRLSLKKHDKDKIKDYIVNTLHLNN